MAEHGYDAGDITVPEFDELVRRRPGLFFGRGDPRSATEVLRGVLDHALHPAARVAPPHVPRVVVEVRGDLAFSVVDDQADALGGRDLPRPGYFGSLLGPNRWVTAAAAALSAHATVEVWRDGRGFRQDLTGLRPTGRPEPFAAPAGAGTRVVLDLDPGFCTAAITTDLGAVDPHGPGCAELPAALVVLRDLRPTGSPAR
ncbi:hypothetical protein ACIQMJ_34900 [Actinosynnema sp. NPDC091369]